MPPEYAAQGLPVDARSYGDGANIVGDLGITRLRLITHNPAKYGGLDGYDLQIGSRRSLPVVETPHNVRHLRTRRDRMGHHLHVDVSTADMPAQLGGR